MTDGTGNEESREPVGSLVAGRNCGQFDIEFLLLAAVARGAEYPWRARKWLIRCYGPKMGWATVSKVFHRMEHAGWMAMERKRRGQHSLRIYRLTAEGKAMLYELQRFYAKVCGMGLAAAPPGADA